MTLSGDVVHETVRACEHLRSILIACGCDLCDVVKATVFLADISDFPVVNDIYAGFFPHKPARSTVQAGALPK